MSLPPPDLEKIVSALLRQARRTGGSLPANGNTIRGILSSSSKEYELRGRADDAYRFLRNYGILVEDTDAKRYYVDSDQAEIILMACERHSAPPDVPDQEERLEALRPANKPERESGEYPAITTESEEPEIMIEEMENEMELENASDPANLNGMNGAPGRFLTPEEFLGLDIDQATDYVALLERHFTDCRDNLELIAELRKLEERRAELRKELAELERTIADTDAKLKKI